MGLDAPANVVEQHREAVAHEGIPVRVTNLEMGYLFEELIRRFSEQSNETAGEHFTPREVVKLMTNLLLSGEDDALRERGIIRTVFDCACGTGGMLSEADAHIRELNPNATVHLYGQELNPESYWIPSCSTRRSTLRVETPLTEASITTATIACSQRWRGSKKLGKYEGPDLVLGIARSISPTWVSHGRWR